MVPTNDTTKHSYIMQKLVYNQKNLLLMGETGVGKSVIINDVLMSLEEKFVYTTLNFSA